MRYIFWILLIGIVFLRILTSQPSYFDGDKIRVSTRVTSEPIRYDDAQYLKIQRLKIYLPAYPEVGYGDFVIIEGTIKDGNLLAPKLIEMKSAGKGIYLFREKLIKVYQKILPEPHSSLVAGVTLGSKSSIPKDFWNSLKKSGTAHVVVASGMNVTLVAGFLVNFFILFFPRKKAVVFALIGIWMYAIVSGFDAPIVRAAVMGSIAFSAQALGRLSSAWRALFVSALFLLIIRPDWISDLGFILSFVATTSLMLFEAKIRKKVAFVPEVFREGLSTSLAAQIGVAPILFVTFGYFNILSPIINALVLWTIVPITTIGMIGGIVGVYMPYLGKLILYLVYPMTSWFVWVVKLFS